MMNVIRAALTPTQRWYTARQFDSGVMSERWLILAGLGAIIILTVLLIVVSYQRRTKEQRTSNRRFLEYADKMGLTQRERRILKDIAARARLRRNVSIFSMVEAFDCGASRLIEGTLALQGVQASKRLSAMTSALREKLGFEKQNPVSVGSARPSSRPNSRQIPTDKKLHLTYPNADNPDNIEGTVINNDNVQLTIRLATPLQSNSGKSCRVRYGYGGSVWEFDASVVSCQGDILILTHSDNVRFINRRRFLRVSVHTPAFIAHFPFARTLPMDAENDEGAKPSSTGAIENTWGALDFVPAVVTELAGPGLRIESPLEVKIGERVLIIFKLSEENRQESPTPHRENSRQPDIERRDRKTALKIVEDIGEIRNTEVIQGGFSVGVELMGLSDSDVNELIRAANAASLKTDAHTQGVPTYSNVNHKQVVPTLV
jgi:hypothetical protein